MGKGAFGLFFFVKMRAYLIFFAIYLVLPIFCSNFAADFVGKTDRTFKNHVGKTDEIFKKYVGKTDIICLIDTLIV